MDSLIYLSFYLFIAYTTLRYVTFPRHILTAHLHGTFARHLARHLAWYLTQCRCRWKQAHL